MDTYRPTVSQEKIGDQTPTFQPATQGKLISLRVLVGTSGRSAKGCLLYYMIFIHAFST